MFVISLIISGELCKTAFRTNANEAVTLAHEWVDKLSNKEQDGYIAIDVQVKGDTENKRFADIRFDEDPDKLKLYLAHNTGQPVFSRNYSPALKAFLFSFLEYSLEKLTEYLNSNKRR